MMKAFGPYKQIIIYTILALLLIPIPFLGIIVEIYGTQLASSRQAAGVDDFLRFQLILLLAVFLACVFYWWRNRQKVASSTMKHTLGLVGIVVVLSIVWFQLLPFPFVSSVSHEPYRDAQGVYQWNLQHKIQWEEFGGARMTSGLFEYVAKTPESRTLIFEKNHQYAGNLMIMGLWIIALGASVGTFIILIGLNKKVYE